MYFLYNTSHYIYWMVYVFCVLLPDIGRFIPVLPDYFNGIGAMARLTQQQWSNHWEYR